MASAFATVAVASNVVACHRRWQRFAATAAAAAKDSIILICVRKFQVCAQKKNIYKTTKRKIRTQ